MDPLSWAGVIITAPMVLGLLYSVLGFHGEAQPGGRHRLEEEQ